MAGREPLVDQGRQPVLEDRDLALAERCDPLGVDVRAQDPVAQVREAGGGRQTDVARSDDRDVTHLARSWSFGPGRSGHAPLVDRLRVCVILAALISPAPGPSDRAARATLRWSIGCECA